MSKVYLISDLHFGHKRILEFAGDYRDGFNVDEHNEILISKWNLIVNNRDKVFVLGDVVMGGKENMPLLARLQGNKYLVRGNHDTQSTSLYLEYFKEVYGLFKYKGFWLSHCPLHPAELRGSINIHGHVHHNSIRDHYHDLDKRYVNVCVEACDGFPVPFESIKDGGYKPKC